MATKKNTTYGGMALAALSWGAFALHDASIKWLVAGMPAWEILFTRSVVIVGLCLAIGRTRLLEQARASRHKGTLLLFGVVCLVGWLLYYSAARYLPLAQLLTLYFAAPVIVTLLAQPMLGERVTLTRWLSVGLGFAGVLAACDPLGLSLSLPAGLALIAAALWGFSFMLMRKMTPSESPMLQMFGMNLTFAIATGAMTAISAVAPGRCELALLGAVGLLGALGQYLLFAAARLAPASVLAPTEYSALLWAFLLGYLIWGDIPDAPVFVGAALILVAGGVLLATERTGPEPARHVAAG